MFRWTTTTKTLNVVADTHMQKQPINVKNDIQSKCNGRKRQRAVKLDARRVMCQQRVQSGKRERGESTLRHTTE